MTADRKVIVVGGGAAGLSAAVELEEHGISCQLIEAQPRLGGRVHTVPAGDLGRIDRGAQMVNGDMSAVLAIARDAGLHCAPVPSTGEDLVVFGNKVLPRRELIRDEEIEHLVMIESRRRTPLVGMRRSAWTMWKHCASQWKSFLGSSQASDDPIAGTDAPKGSMAAAIERMRLCAEDEAIVRTQICEQYGADPGTLDALAVSAGLSRYDSERADLEFQFPSGLGEIVAALAARLGREPVLNAVVKSIEVDDDHVVVTTGDREWHGNYAIVAVPPTIARTIRFTMDRQARLQEVLRSFQAGDLIKTILVYDDPFWRMNGFSGRATFADPQGLEVVDASFDDGSKPRLAAFLGGSGARARAGLTTQDRQARLLGDLSRAFGSKASRPSSLHEAVWVDDPWSGGGYNASVLAGHCSHAVERLANWKGRVRFAGAELDDRFAGYVEGAIRNGRAVAASVIKADCLAAAGQ